MSSTVVAPTRWNQANDEFLAYMRDERHAKENTINAYRLDLVQMEEFMSSKGYKTPSEVSSDDLHAFISSLVEAGAASSTVARKVASARMFFNFVQAEDLTPTNPAEDLTGPPVVTNKDSVSLSEDQVTTLLATCKNKRFMPKRDTAMMTLAVRLGLNSSEIVDLRLAGFNQQEETLYVTLNGRGRTISLPEYCVNDLVSYIGLERSRIPGNRKSPFLFLGRNGEKLTRQGLWLITSTCAEHAGIPKCSVRLLRNTAAKRMLQDGMAEDDIRKTLGLSEDNKLNLYR